MGNAEPEEVEFQVDAAGGFTLRGDAIGTGSPTLLFLHYWGGSGRTWRLVAGEFADRFRCVAIDQRGWGRSDKPDAGSSIAELAGDAQSVIDQLAAAEVVLVGHSMGGKVAQLVAMSRPKQLAGLVLVAPAPAKPAVEFDDEGRRQLLGAYANADGVNWSIDNVLAHRELSYGVRQQVVSDSLSGSPSATSAWPMGAISEDVSSGIHGIDAPTLVIGADHDVVEPVELLREHVVAEIPGARMAVIEDSGHLIPLEQPQPLAQEIASFVGRGSASH